MEQAQSFHGSTASEAMAAVKRSLGDNAVIITLRERPGDPQRRYEIDATRGEADLPRPPSKPASTVLALPQTRPANPDLAARSPLLPPRAALEGRPVEQLERAGLDPTIKARILERALGLQRAGDSGSDALRTACAELASAAPAPWVVGAGGRRVIAFVGPTGSGKTTTLAKVAAQGVLAKQRVALITTDTWRVGGSQHLTRYGEIMGLPSYIAASEQELLAAVKHARGSDLVLIDTPGRSPRSLRDTVCVTCVSGVEVHLVVSVGSSVAQLARVRLRHQNEDAVALVCTKLDEVEPTQEVSALLNAAGTLGLPVAATADGQAVPDDVTAFDPAWVQRRIGGAR